MFSSLFRTRRWFIRPGLLRRTVLWLSLACLPALDGSSFALEIRAYESSSPFPCETAEDCFRSAVAVNEKADVFISRDQQLSAKIDRLRAVMERHPASLWAKRAGLLIGVLLSEHEPAAALRFLRAAQRDFPVLDDYVRFWQGEALLRAGDAWPAAVLLDSIVSAVPDTLLAGRAAFRAGEAWYRAGSCEEATARFLNGLALNDKDPDAPSALLRLADCAVRDGRFAEGRAYLRQVWSRYPQMPEAREAQSRLGSGIGGEPWSPQADDVYARALAFLGLSLHAEAIEELRAFLAMAPQHPRRHEARLKLAIAYVRLKQYDQAKTVFRELGAERVPESNEAIVWLARIYLREGEGEKLLDLAQSLAKSSLSAEQKATVQFFTGIWLEDQARYAEAIERYRQAAKTSESMSQRLDALWRIGWVQYRIGRFRDASDTFHTVAAAKDRDWEPQALYWAARALEHEERSKDQAKELYQQVCQRYVFTYYCQLARKRAEVPASQPALMDSPSDGLGLLPSGKRVGIEREAGYRRAVELKILGLDQDAARELAALTERFGRDQEVVLALSTLLSEAGAHHQALRLARLHFREKLERGGGGVSSVLWNLAYPIAFLPIIQAQAAKGVDPHLVAAIIREESQYDRQAVSRVGAIGLMQVMPTTANQVARRLGVPGLKREDLFDQETNIRIGVRYLEQLMEQFSGNPIYAIAAYNAGPAAVNAWIAMNRGRDADEFVESIPYQETRQYVKRVLRSYHEYLRLNSGAF